MEDLAKSSRGIEISLAPPSDLASLETVWHDLEDRSDCSFFQSWNWVGTWLHVLPAQNRPEILTAVRDGRVVGLCALARNTMRRHGVLTSHGLYLTETGDPQFDALTVEYNGILADRAVADDTTQAIVLHLVREMPGWDEFYLSGVPADRGEAGLARIAQAAGLSVHRVDRKDCNYVDLARLNGEGVSYLDGLGKNTRYQIRRSLRRYGERGEIELSCAGDADQARLYLDKMKALHQAYWTSRGHPGAFANPFFETFHEELIRRCTASGETQLIRVAAGGKTIGVLYNFVWRDHVYNYQSGFTYEDDNAIKPGLTSHYLAIEHYLADGAAKYDFLAGTSRYKSSLGTDVVPLDWVTARRTRLRYMIEDVMRSVKQSLRPSNDATLSGTETDR